MRHDEIREILPLYLTGDLETLQETEIAEHLEECADCAEELRVLAGLTARIEALRSAAPILMPRRPGLVGLVRAAAILGAFLLGMGAEALRGGDPPRSTATAPIEERVEIPTPHDLARAWQEIEPAPSGLARVLLAQRRLP